MEDTVSFLAHHEFVAAFRFMVWSSMFAVVLMLVSKLRDRPKDRIPIIGAMLIIGALAAHQCFYWLWHRGNGRDNSDLIKFLAEHRLEFTSFVLVVMAIGALMQMQWFLSRQLGKYWFPAGLGIIVALWCVGYGDAAWL